MNRFPVFSFGWKGSLSLLTAALSLACGDDPPPPPAFVFNRPEHLEFVCIDPSGTASPDESSDGGVNTPLVLPLRCCAAPTPLNPTAFFAEGSGTDYGCGVGSHSLHALVTQSTRGEVAAVDLEAGRVLDSDQRIPGYTFVDVGGLPRAIVTPPHHPGDEKLGPPWTYVATAEEQSVRAIATCHFREGAKCGPEGQRDFEPDEITRRLPAQPRDMVFVPEAEGRPAALWVTLPDVGALARIDLPTDSEEPFVLDMGDPLFFALPVLEGVTPAEPIDEAAEYISSCGLGYSVDVDPMTLAAGKLLLPASTSEPGLGVASLSRIRFDTQSNLLLVADASQPVIHALSIKPEGLLVNGVIATGAAVRDFALTPAVPKEIAAPRTFVGDEEPTFGDDEQRYLYAIDDRDGSVMVQTFSQGEEGLVTTVPLRVPAARKHSDRLPLAAPALALEVVDNRKLTYRGATEEDPLHGLICDLDRTGEVDEDAVAAKKRALEAAQDRLEQAEKNGTGTTALANEYEAAQTAVKDATLASSEAEAEGSILGSAGPKQLRGVYVLITTVSGALTVVDVHDLDVFCRGQSSCDDEDANILESDNKVALPVAVRRHASRITGYADSKLTVNDPEPLAKIEACEPGFHVGAYRGTDSSEGTASTGGGGEGTTGAETPASGANGDSTAGTNDQGGTTGGATAGTGTTGGMGSTRSATDLVVCSASNPWLTESSGWVATWEGAYLSAVQGRFDKENGKLVLYAPQGIDLCERGVVSDEMTVEDVFDDADELKLEYEGDWVAVTGEPPSYAIGNCPVPKAGEEAKLRVLTASRSKFELELDANDGRSVDEWLDCYPDLVGFELRANDRYLVVNANTGTPLHRVVAEAGDVGKCVEDPRRKGERRLVSRAARGQKFKNVFTHFELEAADANGAAPNRDSQIQVSSGANAVAQLGIGAGGTESLPVTVRYLDIRGEVFVVDVAQGLRRFTLTPKFEIDPRPYR